MPRWADAVACSNNQSRIDKGLNYTANNPKNIQTAPFPPKIWNEKRTACASESNLSPRALLAPTDQKTMTKTTVTPDAEDRGGGVLMASDDEDAITPVTKKHKLTTPIQPPKFKSLFADMEGCDSIDRIEAEQRRKSIALDSDSDDGDGALKNLQSLTWLKTPVGARRKKKVKKNDGGGNGDGLGGFALSGDQESTGISKDVDLDLGRLVPDRETTGGLNPESLQGLFSSEPENVNTTLSKEDVASLLDQNNKMADVTEEIDTPLEMNVSLMTHQKRALAWMSKREVRDKSTPRNHPRGGILAGKTSPVLFCRSECFGEECEISKCRGNVQLLTDF